MRITRLILAACAALAAGCADPPTHPPERTAVPVRIQAALAPGLSIAGLAVVVSGPGIPVSIVVNLPTTGASIAGAVDVPVGADRRFVVHAYDAHGQRTHSGERTVTVLAGTNPVVSIALQPLIGGVPIVVTLGSLGIALDVAEATVAVGGTTTVTATVTDGGAPLATGVVQWGVLNPVLVGLAPSADGRTLTLTGRLEGSTTLAATFDGVTVAVPLTITAAAPPPSFFREVDAGAGYTCALDHAGAAWCWGFPGALGNGDFGQRLAPTRVSGGHQFVGISTGQSHACGVTLEGEAWCWGNDDFGQLGNGVVLLGGVPAPIRVSGGHTFRSVVAGMAATCGITTAGAAHCWGSGAAGTIGLRGEGSNATIPAPSPVTEAPGPWSSMSLAEALACGVATDGLATCVTPFGTGPVRASAGHGGLRWATLRVSDWKWDANELPVMSIGYQYPFACGIDVDGVLRCWGSNEHGQIGQGSTSEVPTTLPAPVSSTFYVWDAVATGGSFACGLLAGTAYCWGRNDFGQVGDGSREHRYEPWTVAGGHAFVRITAGLTHACGLRADGALFCWGANAWGEVGDGTTTVRSSPVRITLGGP